MLHEEGLKGLIIFLVVAGVIVPLFHRARIGTVLGFLIAGAVLGPHGLGRLAETHPVVGYITFDNPQRGEVLAEFGIITLLFLLGLELSLQRLWQLRRYVLGVGLVQMAVTTVAIGAAVRLAGGVAPSGVVLGLCLALSSTAIAMQLLMEQHRAASLTGRVALSVLLFQDMMVVPVLFVVELLTRHADGAQSGDIVALFRPFVGALATVVAIMLLGRYVVRPLLHSAIRTGSRDLIMAIVLLILVVVSVITGLAGLSGALGAFLAGLLLSDSEARHHIEVDLEPFKGLLLGIFFITVGTRVDAAAIMGDIGWILLGVLLLMAGKAAILFGAARAFGVPKTAAADVALLLAQASEFGFVVLGVAQSGGLLSDRLAGGAIAVVALTMLATPLTALAGRRLASRLDRPDSGDDGLELGAAELENHVVIGGFGRVGRLVASVLEAENVPYVGLDTDGEQVRRLRRQGAPVYFGDAGRLELLERIGASSARAFVVTPNDARAAERMVAAARKIKRDALIFARAADEAHAERLVELGAVGVIPETVEAGLQLAGRLLSGLEISDELIARRLTATRVSVVERMPRRPPG